MDAKYERYLKKSVIALELEIDEIQRTINEEVEKLVKLQRELENNSDALKRNEIDYSTPWVDLIETMRGT